MPMKKQVLVGLFLFLISCFSAPCLLAQTLRESSEKAYSLLNGAKPLQKITLLHELISYRVIDSVDRAKTLAFIAIEESKKQKNETLEAASLVWLGSVYLSKNNPDSAELCIIKAGKYYEHNVGDLNYANFLFYKGRINLLKNNTKEAIQYYNQSIIIAGKQNDYKTLGNAYWNLAEYFKEIQKPKEFLLNLTKAEESYRKSKNIIHSSRMFIGLGVSYLDLGLIEKANQQFITAIQMLEKTADSLFMAYTYTNIASLYVSPSRDKNKEYYTHAIKIFRAIKNDRGTGYALNLYAQEFLNDKEYTKSIPIFKEAAALKEKSSDWQGASFVYGNLAETYILLNKGIAAKQMIDAAEKMAQKAGDKLSMATAINTKGIYLRYKKDFAAALIALEKSLELCRELNIQSLITDNLLDISETYQAKGDAANALKFYKLYTTSKDSIVNASNVVQIADLQMKYETQKKDSQIKSLLNQTLSTKKGQYYIIGNIVAIILILFIAIIFFFRLKGNYSERIQLMLTLQNKVKNQKEKAIEFFSPIMPDKATKPLLTKTMQQQLWLQLKELTEKEKIYLRNDISLSELARRLNTNTAYLSKVINETTGENFSNFLNQYRIEEACCLLSNPKGRSMTIEGIAQTVGFNSKSAFNIAFKKIKSVTPSEYLNQQFAENQHTA